MFGVVSHCVYKEFPYTDQYRILQEHLAIINGMEQTAPEVDSGVFNTRGHNTNNQVSMEEEEEWSTCEEDEINGDDDEEES